MIGNSINLGLENIWQSWFSFRKGKRMTAELHEFQFYLEKNLFALQCDLVCGMYHHGPYKTFTVCDNKRREISVSGIRDRVVHRLLYDYLVPIFDKTFIYDAWSCRTGKGLLGAIERAQEFLRKNPHSYVWRADIRKFFDSVNQAVLLECVGRRVSDPQARRLITEVIRSFFAGGGGLLIGIPIGNLTSQIFANIYLNELDRFVKHELRVKCYLRYGDDFILVCEDLEKLKEFRVRTIEFLAGVLKLNLNLKNDKIFKARHGLRFLGVVIWPTGRKLNKRSIHRVQNKLSHKNVSSYYGLTHKHGFKKWKRKFAWLVHELIYCIKK